MKKLNFPRFLLDNVLNSTDATINVTTAKKYKRGQKSGGNDQFYDLVKQRQGGNILNFRATVEEKNGTLVESLSINGVASNGQTEDGREKYTLTVEIADDSTTKMRGMANDDSGTNSVLNVITDNIVDQFPAKSKLKIVWDVSELQNLENLFVAGSTITLPFEAGEDSIVRRAISKHTDTKWYKFTAGKISFVGINTEAFTSGSSYTISTYGAIVTGFTGLTDAGAVYADYVLAGGAATAAIASPAVPGNVDDGNHDYKVTFEVPDVTATYETDGGTASGSVTIADKTVNGKIELTAIPTSTNGNVTSRKIYRRFNGAGDYKLLTTIADNTTLIFTDNVANASLGAVLPTANLATGLITQSASGTSIKIGQAEGTAAIRLALVPDVTSAFSDDGFETFDDGDSSKKIKHDSAAQAASTTTTIASEAQSDTKWTIPDEDATEKFASQDYADTAGSGGGGTGSSFVSHPNSAAMTKGDSVYIDEVSTFADATAATSIGYDVTKEKAAIPFVGSGNSTSQLNLALKKTGTPTDNLLIRIETDTAGEPSGTLIDPNATETIAGAGLTTSFVDILATFVGAFTPAVNTLYWIVLERSGPNNVTDYFQTGGDSAVFSFFSTWQFNAGVWVEDPNRQAYVGSFTGMVTQIVTKTDSNTSDNQKNFLGFVSATKAAFQDTNIDVSGVSNTQTGLTPGGRYYLDSTPGAITTTAAAGIRVGFAVSTTAIRIDPDFTHDKEFDINVAANTIDLLNQTTNFSVKHNMNRIPAIFHSYIRGSQSGSGSTTTVVHMLKSGVGEVLVASAANGPNNAQAYVGIDSVTDDTLNYHIRWASTGSGGNPFQGSGSRHIILL